MSVTIIRYLTGIRTDRALFLRFDVSHFGIHPVDFLLPCFYPWGFPMTKEIQPIDKK
ncbi:hypothetical protein DaDZ19_24540 [Dickeya ananatis]